jgi:hypothetical protein
MSGTNDYINMLAVANEARLKDAARIAELTNALSLLIDRAGECDSWESFPESWLDEAFAVLLGEVDSNGLQE